MRTHMKVATVVLGAALALGASSPQAQPAAAPRDQAVTTCRKLPAGKRIVRLNLKPDTNVADLVVWIASVTCKQFILPGGIPATSKTVTIVSPQLLTPEEAYRLFLDALDSVGLTVFRTGAFFRVIESAKAIHSPIPVIVPGQDTGEEPDVPRPDGQRENVARPPVR
jgi:hypothetical protein